MKTIKTKNMEMNLMKKVIMITVSSKLRTLNCQMTAGVIIRLRSRPTMLNLIAKRKEVKLELKVKKPMMMMMMKTAT